MPGSTMEHPARPFYREGTFHALVGVATAAALVLAYRGLHARRRRRPAPAGFVSEAVLALDLVDSTHLATHYGDAVAMRARTALEERTRRAASPRGPSFLETTGDGCLVTFPSVAAAMDAARGLLRDLAAEPPDVAPALPLEVRLGLSYGELLLDDRGGRHGAAINKAFRLLGLTPGSLVHLEGQEQPAEVPARTRILIDEEALTELGAGAGRSRLLGFAALKGFSGLHRIYEVPWQPQPVIADVMAEGDRR
jgi:class 3 adenylate cyclase